MNGMFQGCESLESIDLSNFETENLEGASYFLHGCKDLIYIDLRKFNTLKLKNHIDFFPSKPLGVDFIYNKTIFNIDIPEKWNSTDISQH